MFIVVYPLDCTPSLKESNRTIAACEGFSLVLECNIRGTGLTVFKGNLLNCGESNHEIVLLHNRFNELNGTRAACNNETILAYSLPFNSSSNCYTSQLCIMDTTDVIGKGIICVHDSDTEKEIGNYTIPTTGIILCL